MPGISELENLRRYFESGRTRSADFRKQQLKKLRESVLAHEEELYTALYTDLRKSREETWVTETGIVVAELRHAIKNVEYWMEPERVPTNLVNFPSTSHILREPLGVVLIISPWNYPFQLLFNPLVGAIAAGNCVVLKPGEYAPATAAVMKKIVTQTFPPEYILYTEGDGATVVPAMMQHFTFDHVFYTGSTATGKLIYKMAAERLVPVTLELGGKSPCVVEADANSTVAAKRIVMTKYSNAGQMCIAPDYVLVHESKKEQLIAAMKTAALRFFGEKAEESYNYCRIINRKQFDRVASYLTQGTLVYGGRTDAGNLFIEPSILADTPVDAPVMNEEIFGPVLPVLSFTTMEEARAIIARHPNPLAFYVFTSSRKKEKEWLDAVPAGSACVNNASWHFTNHHLPFGGRGASGTGQYHGKFSFDTFSHRKPVLKTPTWFDPAIKYPPFKGKLRLFKWVIK